MTVTFDYVREIFKGLKYGDVGAFFMHVAEDVDWTVMGAHPFAGEYRSRAALAAGTFAKLAQVLPRGARLHLEHLVVSDSRASIWLHALVAAKNGLWFDNHYCWIVRFRGDEIVGAGGDPDSAMIARSAKSNDRERYIYLTPPARRAEPSISSGAFQGRRPASTASGSMRSSAAL